MTAKSIVMAAANAGPANYIDDVFSTWLYTGNGGTNTITNGIDLAGKGGMVWIKNRASAVNHAISDNVSSSLGFGTYISSNTTTAASSDLNSFQTFDSNGFSVKQSTLTGASSNTYASWTFRRQPKFFDVVTFTAGLSNNQRVPHSLGSVPGCIMVKAVSTTQNWFVYHQASTNGRFDVLNLNATTAATYNATPFWGTSNPTSTDFGINAALNLVNGATYVAYVFAHNAGGFGLSGADNVITCDSFTTNGSGVGSYTLNYEPQWVMVKRIDSASGGDWTILDDLRGWTAPAGTNQQQRLQANTSTAETAQILGYKTSTGFVYQDNASATYIFIAIRRSMKVPTTGTSVFAPVAYSGTGTNNRAISASFPPDAVFYTYRDVSSSKSWYARLQGNGNGLAAESINGEFGLTTVYGPQFNSVQGGYVQGTGDSAAGGMNPSGNTFITYMLKRANGFFDQVFYSGNSASQTISHNLGVAPELIIVKSRTSSVNWAVYVNSLGAGNYLSLNLTSGSAASTTYWNNTAPTASAFSVGATGSTNGSGNNYAAWLFASCPGVSKVGSYTGNGGTQTINCGFASGARFVMIKRTDTNAPWVFWDTARGMVSGTNPYLQMNATTADINLNSVFTTAGGFQLVSSDTFSNANGGSYIYLAIA